MSEENEKIPYHRPYALTEDDIEVIKWKIEDVLKSGQLTNGVRVQQLEEKIKKMYNVEHCIATSNCTMGLYLCYKHYSDDIINMPNFTWMSPYLITLQEKQVWDIEVDTWLMDTNEIYPEDGILSPCHTFGNICIVEGDEKLIFDGAHALGSKIKNIGTATVFSLAPTKLVTSCEGGLIITNDDVLAEGLRFERDKCARMSEVHAIIGLQTLFYLEFIKEWKKKVYNHYSHYIPGRFQVIETDSNYNTIGFLNVNKLKIPEHIETRQYYEPLLKLDYQPLSNYVYNNMVCLPSYYGVDYRLIVEQILEANK